MSWVGQAVVASGLGDSKNSATLLEHAVSLSADLVSTGISWLQTLPHVTFQPIPNLEFAYRAFRGFQASTSNQKVQSDLGISAFFALERCLQRRSKDATALHLASLISERLGLASRAVTFADRSARLLESAYEKSEDPQTARRYAITQSTLGRILLSDGAYDKACESFEIVLGLVEKIEDSEGSDSEAALLRSQAHLGSGLAKLISGEVETAISTLEAGIQETSGSSSFVQTQLTVLLAQTMWMLGTEEAHEAAKSLLLERYEI
jgi:superkiller protein 3